MIIKSHQFAGSCEKDEQTYIQEIIFSKEYRNKLQICNNQRKTINNL
jgi:hypothetical protein